MLLVEQEAAEVLMSLGLTYQQTKVYLATCNLDHGSVKLISQSAQIARSEVYRAIAGLQKIGIVEKVIANPIEYKSLPLVTSLQMLVLRKKQEINALEQKARKVSQLKEKKIISMMRDDEPQFRLTYIKPESRDEKKIPAWQTKPGI